MAEHHHDPLPSGMTVGRLSERMENGVGQGTIDWNNVRLASLEDVAQDPLGYTPTLSLTRVYHQLSLLPTIPPAIKTRLLRQQVVVSRSLRSILPSVRQVFPPPKNGHPTLKRPSTQLRPSKPQGRSLTAAAQNVADSLERHVPLQVTATIPPGHRDMSGRVMQYEEGADLMREAGAPGGAYRRWEHVVSISLPPAYNIMDAHSRIRGIYELQQRVEQYLQNPFETDPRPSPRGFEARDADLHPYPPRMIRREKTKNISLLVQLSFRCYSYNSSSTPSPTGGKGTFTHPTSSPQLRERCYSNSD